MLRVGAALEEAFPEGLQLHLSARLPLPERCAGDAVLGRGHRPGWGQGWHQAGFGKTCDFSTLAGCLLLHGVTRAHLLARRGTFISAGFVAVDGREGGCSQVLGCQAQLLEQRRQMPWMMPTRTCPSSPRTQPFGEVSISCAASGGLREAPGQCTDACMWVQTFARVREQAGPAVTQEPLFLAQPSLRVSQPPGARCHLPSPGRGLEAVPIAAPHALEPQGDSGASSQLIVRA